MMKKHILFLLAVVILCGATAGAAIREQWTFQKDAAGTLLANAINSGGDAGDAFGAGGDGILEADGVGSLLSTPAAANLWDEGVTLDAGLSSSADVLFLRYDLTYDLTSGLNTSGTALGLYFSDATGTNVAGLALAYNPAGSGPAPAGNTLTHVADDLAFSGMISAIAKVDLSGSPTMTVWYDTTGGNSFDEFTPAVENVPVLNASISDLRIQAMGSASGDTNDFVAVENIRVADSWADISGSVESSVESQYLNEWQFDRDIAGRTLAEAVNSGTDGASFSADGVPVTQTDGLRSLVCSNDVAGAGDFWMDGAILRADVTNNTTHMFPLFIVYFMSLR